MILLAEFEQDREFNFNREVQIYPGHGRPTKVQQISEEISKVKVKVNRTIDAHLLSKHY